MTDMNSDNRHRTPRVITVVLNYNQHGMTREMLADFQEKGWGGSHVLLVDNDSSDGSAEKIRREFPGVEVLETGRNLGCSGGRNFGARAALERGAEFIFCVDNDTYVAEDCIASMVAHMERDPAVGILGARVMRHPETDLIWSLGTHVDWDRCDYKSIQEEPGEIPSDGLLDAAWVPGTAWMVRASVFEDVGFIDDRYFIYFEDTDFSFRIRQKGLRVAVAPDAVIWHRERSSMDAGSPRSAYYYTRNRLLFFTAYSPRPLFSRWFLSSRALLWSLRLMGKNEWRVAGAVIKGLRDAALGRWGERKI